MGQSYALEGRLRMAHIDYYFSTLSPFAYLAGGRLEEIAAQHGIIHVIGRLQ